MKFSTSFSAYILSFAALASAAPAPGALALPDGWEPITSAEILSRRAAIESGLRKRTPGGIFLCTGENWTGTCGYAVQPLLSCDTATCTAHACVILTSPWLRNIGSFGPDPGATVFISNNGDCNEAVGSIAYPGSGTFFSDPDESGNGMGGEITSFLCEAS